MPNHDQRTAEIQWEDAYALAHNGERPPAGSYPPISNVNAVASTGSMNKLAVLALVVSIIGSVVGIVLGHVARSQIRRTGESGAGVALAAIIIGWIGVGIIVIFYAILLG